MVLILVLVYKEHIIDCIGVGINTGRKVCPLKQTRKFSAKIPKVIVNVRVRALFEKVLGV